MAPDSAPERTPSPKPRRARAPKPTGARTVKPPAAPAPRRTPRAAPGDTRLGDRFFLGGLLLAVVAALAAWIVSGHG